MSTKLYVGCALKHAPEDFKAFVSSCKQLMREQLSVEMLEFVGLTAGTAKEVYAHDLNCVQTCDAMIAFVDLPSLGLGMELQEAIRNSKPILALSTDPTIVTRMLLGAQENGAPITLKQYTNHEDVVACTREFLATL